MDDFNLIHAVLISLPEGIILVLIVLQLLNVPFDKFKAGLIAVLYAGSTFIIRNLYIPYGIHTILTIFLTAIYISVIFKIDTKASVLSLFVYAVMSGISETISVFIFENMTGITFETALNSTYLRILINIPIQIVLLIMFAVLHRSNIHFNVRGLDKNEIKDSKMQKVLLAIISFILLQNFIIILIYMCYKSSSQYNVFTYTFINLFPLLSILLIAMSIFMIGIMRKSIYFLERENQYELQSVMFDNIQEVIRTLRKERHNYVNDLQVLYGLLMEQKNEQARSYLSNIFTEVAETNQYINIGSPAVSGLIIVKREMAITKGIRWEELLNADLALLNVEVQDLCRLYGNLMQNAIEGAEECYKKEVILKLYKDDRGFIVFDIKNTYNCNIKDFKSMNIFDYHISTKGENRGTGLYIAKQIVNKHKGNIEVNIEHEEIQFLVMLPF